MENVMRTAVCVLILVSGASCCQVNQTYPHHNDCSLFYRCESPGNKVLLSCPAGQHYDEEAGRCDTPERANCTIPDNPEEATTEQSTEADESSTEVNVDNTVVDLINTSFVMMNSSDGIYPGTELVEGEYENESQSQNQDNTDERIVEVFDGGADNIPKVENTTDVDDIPRKEDSDVLFDENSRYDNVDKLSEEDFNATEKDDVPKLPDTLIPDTIIDEFPRHSLGSQQPSESDEEQFEYQKNSTSLDNIPGLKTIIQGESTNNKTEDIQLLPKDTAKEVVQISDKRNTTTSSRETFSDK